MAPKGWKRPFDQPIPLQRGRALVTLRDAGSYITKLPKAEHEAPEWQAAMQALILVATKGGPTMLPRLNAGGPPEPAARPATRKKAGKKYRVVK